MTDPREFSGSDTAVRDLLEKQRKVRRKKRQEQKDGQHPIPCHSQDGRFVSGPIPCDWLKAALLVDGKSANLAWAVWWLVGITRGNPIKLRRRVLADMCVSHQAARRILNRWEELGLAKVDRCLGRTPVVTLLATTPPADNRRSPTDRRGVY